MGELLQNLESVYSRWERGPVFSTATENLADRNYDKLMQTGRRAWSDRFGDLDYRKPQRRTRTTRQAQLPAFDPLTTLGEFKVQPILHPSHVTCRRPMMGRCCECLIVSKKNFYTDETPMAGFRDVLRVEQQNKRNNLLVRSTSHVLYTLSRDQSHKYPDVTHDVIGSMRVEEAIEKTATQLSGNDLRLSFDTRLGEDFDAACKEARKNALRMLAVMKATTSNWMLRLTGWFLLKILGRLLNTLVVHQGQMEMVKKAYKKNKHVPVVLLPLHRSHLDYIVLTFVLWNWNVPAPFVAAGDNLNIPFFRWLLKGLGGFFIRRKIDKDSGKKDLLYRAVLQSYMSEVLRRGENMEFFLEGGRSRSGRVLHPKAGLLSVVMETFLEGTIPDVYLVPVSISYERIVDGDFTDEQMGGTKKKETFWRALKAIFRVLRTNFGNARVDLGQPFSLQEYYSVVRSTNRALEPTSANQSESGNSSNRSDSSSPSQSGERLSGSNTSLYGTDVVAEEQRNLVQGLAEHIVYNSVKTTAVMSTNLVAYLLLNKFRDGVTMTQLILNVDWLRDEITIRGRDLGFSGKSHDVIVHALSILGSGLVSVVRQEGSERIVRPSLELPGVLDLAYYANVAGMIFTVDSVMATAVLASCDEDLTVYAGENVSISKDLLMGNAEFLITLLKYEFLITPPCTSVQTILVETVETFLARQLLSRSDEAVGSGRTTRSAAGHSYSFQSDSEDDELLDTDEKLEVECKSGDFELWYPLLWTSLAPVVEAYWVTSCCLHKLLRQDMEETEFMKVVHGVAKQRVLDGCASFVESMAYDTIKNALCSYQNIKITEIYTINGLKMVSLCDSYTCQEALNDLVARVEKFRL